MTTPQAVLAGLALIAGAILLTNAPTSQAGSRDSTSAPRYQMEVAEAGRLRVFVMDSYTGKVGYCNVTRSDEWECSTALRRIEFPTTD